jgi:hypothetical protein
LNKLKETFTWRGAGAVSPYLKEVLPSWAAPRGARRKIMKKNFMSKEENGAENDAGKNQQQIS